MNGVESYNLIIDHPCSYPSYWAAVKEITQLIIDDFATCDFVERLTHVLILPVWIILIFTLAPFWWRHNIKCYEEKFVELL